MVIELIGWAGSILIILAYAMNMFKMLAADSAWYYSLNIAGSAGLAVNTIYHNAVPSTVVNVVWIGIALIAVIKRPRKVISKTPGS